MPQSPTQTPHTPFTAGLVSIIMPAFNAQSFLTLAIESVLAQSYANWELLVIDDASTDATASIVRSYALRDPRVRLLTNHHGKGVVGARNSGIDTAQGEFIAFLDSDDSWLPNKLTAQVALMRDSGCALSATAYRMVDAQDAPLGEVRVPARIHYTDLLKGNCIGCLTALYSRARLGKVYMPSGFHHEDYLTWLGILREHGPAAGLDDILALYRKHGQSLSSSKGRAAVWQWRIYRDALRMPLWQAAYYFVNYAVRGVLKHRR